ncbi:MAG: hypothetical protein KC486_08815 [Myxococcales bacterium]|jgi:hypothetical protein|nr:hypothetical protein [Myxococcales bacterium]
MAKRRRRKKTTTGHAPLFLGTLGLSAIETAARAARYRGKGASPEEAWRNATADVIEKAAKADTDAADALAEAAETIREGGK